MTPILLDLTQLKVILVGEGEAFSKRLAFLTGGGGVSEVEVYTSGKRPTSAHLVAAQVVFVAGLDETESGAIAGVVRASGGLVNVEDIKPLCDFHVPSLVRRGDLVLTVSTGGKSPGLARRLRRYLETLFGPEWAERLDEMAEKRDNWRGQNLNMAEISRRSDEHIEEKGWLS
jgi:precorrin-2 dehydrogenase/sirohydrochlorin ferrochelatase